jgi:hypothetical protein
MNLRMILSIFYLPMHAKVDIPSPNLSGVHFGDIVMRHTSLG